MQSNFTDSPRPARVGVVIVNYNSGGLLADCLRSLAAQSRPADRVLVVDNASEDDSARAARQAGVELIESDSNLGFAAANNLAFAALSDCEWLLLLNPDAFVAPDCLAALLRAAARHPDAASFACRLLDDADPRRLDGSGDVYHVSGLAWRRGHGRPASLADDNEERIFAACAAAALYRRAALEESGGLDEDFFTYFEDVDLGFRLRLLGYECWYVPDAVARHVGSAISGYRSAFAVYHGHRNLVWCYIKNMPRALFWRYLPQHLLLNLLTVGWFCLTGKPGPILRAKWHALLGVRQAWRKRVVIQAAARATPRAIRGCMSGGVLKPYLRRLRSGRRD